MHKRKTNELKIVILSWIFKLGTEHSSVAQSIEMKLGNMQIANLQGLEYNRVWHPISRLIFTLSRERDCLRGSWAGAAFNWVNIYSKSFWKTVFSLSINQLLNYYSILKMLKSLIWMLIYVTPLIHQSFCWPFVTNFWHNDKNAFEQFKLMINTL